MMMMMTTTTTTTATIDNSNRISIAAYGRNFGDAKLVGIAAVKREVKLYTTVSSPRRSLSYRSDDVRKFMRELA